MEIPCPACGRVVPAEQLVHGVDGPPLCASCAAIELARQGPRVGASAHSRSYAGEGSFWLGFTLGFLCCFSLAGFFMPSVGKDTRRGIALGIVASVIFSCVVNAWAIQHPEYWRQPPPAYR